MPDQSDSWFRNRGLFSDHFLKARLPQWKEWGIGGELATFRRGILSLYESKKSILPELNEAQTEQEFVQPLLDLLGYTYMVQAPTKLGQQAKRPDYALFPDEATKNRAYAKVKKNDYTQCIGIADAKHWERELDLAKKSERDTLTNQNPSFQIANYLTSTQQRWGILTNGRLWRLYSTKSHVPLGNYYQIDLIQLLDNAPQESLKYFYLFFCKEALVQMDGRSFLDRVFEGSDEYAIELESDIKERAYEVVESLCRGFAAVFQPEQLTEPTLKTIYDNSLALLYRLLFVFYAEARELLPLTASASYRDNYSIHKIANDIDEVLKKGQELSGQSTQYYYCINNLFHLIDNGDPGLGVPEYNGGLFDPEEHPFLHEQAITDRFLVPAVHKLASTFDKRLAREVAVDYNTLSERHLGSIYEGLLEFKPQIARFDLVTLKEKGSTKYASASRNPGKKVVYCKGDLYLVNDKGERKASGSYYTPEYIVDYIVKNSLDPLTKEAQAKTMALKPDVDKAVAKWQKLKEQKKGLEPVEKYDRKIAEERERLLGPYLSLRVLDPAMGSGHFLARATDFLAEAIATDPCIEAPTEITEDSELTYYRRRVVESSIYGADLNPLAVELAKLTLWLATMAKSKPLSFLNHHLRVGNSLIGARASEMDEIPKPRPRKGKALDLSRAPVQLGLFQSAFAKKLYVLLQSRALIASLPTETLEDVHQKEEWEREFDQNAVRFRTLADIWASTYCGNDVRWDEYNNLVENLQSPQLEWERLLEKKSIKKALAMHDERHFFHWELEFPEVFYDDKGSRRPRAGFDAVVGNPPYVGIRGLGEEDSDLLFDLFATTRNRANVYAAFVERGLGLLRDGGSIAMIVPNTLMTQSSYRLLRQRLLTATHLRKIVRVPESSFADQKVETMVFCASHRNPTPEDRVEYIAYPDRCRISSIGEEGYLTHGTMLQMDVEDRVGALWASDATTELLLERIEACTRPLEDICEFSLGITPYDQYKGHTKSQIDGKVFHASYKKDDSYRPLLRGGDIQRFLVCWNGEDWISYGDWLGAAREERFFTVPRVLVKQMIDWTSRRIHAGYTEEGLCNTQIAFNLIPRDSRDCQFLTAMLNSRLLTFYHKHRFLDTVKQRFQKILIQDAKQLPIRRIEFTTPDNLLRQLLKEGETLCGNSIEKGEWAAAIAFVDQCLPNKPDGSPDMSHEHSDVVHGLLALLAEEMTRLHKEKQARSQAFLSWLESEVLKGPIQDQKNKTAIREFHENTFEDLLDVLKKNKTVPDPCTSSVRETIAAEFSAAVGVLTPLKARIDATDKLIDRIVYRLYNLADDERSTVEGQES